MDELDETTSSIPDDGSCCRCGEPGTYTCDPYVAEIHNEYIYDYFCEACLDDMSDDI